MPQAQSLGTFLQDALQAGDTFLIGCDLYNPHSVSADQLDAEIRKLGQRPNTRVFVRGTGGVSNPIACYFRGMKAWIDYVTVDHDNIVTVLAGVSYRPQLTVLDLYEQVKR